LDELCQGQPAEIKEFMNYSRGLAFTADPDYRYILGLFEGCMERNGYDFKTPDFIWNKNRLAIEKQQLKENMKKALVKNTTTTAKKDDKGNDEGAGV